MVGQSIHPLATFLQRKLYHSRYHHPELQCLDHGLDTEGARLHRICEEVSLEEPLPRIDVLDGADATQAGLAPLRPKAVDPSDHQQHGIGEAQRLREVPRRPACELDVEVAREGQGCPVLVRRHDADLGSRPVTLLE